MLVFRAQTLKVIKDQNKQVPYLLQKMIHAIRLKIMPVSHYQMVILRINIKQPVVGIASMLEEGCVHLKTEQV